MAKNSPSHSDTPKQNRNERQTPMLTRPRLAILLSLLALALLTTSTPSALAQEQSVVADPAAVVTLVEPVDLTSAPINEQPETSADTPEEALIDFEGHGSSEPTLVEEVTGDEAATDGSSDGQDAPADVDSGSVWPIRAWTADGYGRSQNRFRRGDDVRFYFTARNASRYYLTAEVTIQVTRGTMCIAIIPDCRPITQVLTREYVRFAPGDSTWYEPSSVSMSSPGGDRRYSVVINGEVASHDFVIDVGGSPSDPYPGPPRTYPPAAPSGLMARANGTSEIQLSWRDNASDETGYRVYGHGTDVRLGANSTSYTVRGLQPNQEICYQIFAYNNAGESGGSNWSCATTEQRQAAPCENVQEGIVLYEHLHAGRCWTFTNDHNDFNLIGANDTVSSIAFRGSYRTGWEAELYQHTGYNGRSAVFTNDNWSFGNTAVGNDQASSIRIRRRSSGGGGDDGNWCHAGNTLDDGQMRTGRLGYGETDTFCIRVLRGEWVTIRMSRSGNGGGGDLDPIVRLHQPNSKVVSNDDGGIELNSMLVHQIEATSWFAVKADRYDGSGEYNILFTRGRNAHPADVDGNHCVNTMDLAILYDSLGTVWPSWDYDPKADVDLNGAVNMQDKTRLEEAYGTGC